MPSGGAADSTERICNYVIQSIISIFHHFIMMLHFVPTCIITEADFLCTKMSEKINGKMEHRVIKEQHPVLLASIEVIIQPCVSNLSHQLLLINASFMLQ